MNAMILEPAIRQAAEGDFVGAFCLIQASKLIPQSSQPALSESSIGRF
jgi:hypothetical protein